MHVKSSLTLRNVYVRGLGRNGEYIYVVRRKVLHCYQFPHVIWLAWLRMIYFPKALGWHSAWTTPACNMCRRDWFRCDGNNVPRAVGCYSHIYKSTRFTATVQGRIPTLLEHVAIIADQRCYRKHLWWIQSKTYEYALAMMIYKHYSARCSHTTFVSI